MGWTVKDGWTNTWFTSKKKILKQLREQRPLPIGRTEFEVWSKRIISGAMLPSTEESQKFTLSNLLLHLGPTESHKEDAFFIHSLRKCAVNQVAIAMRQEIKDIADARLEKEEAQKIINQPGEVLPKPSDSNEAKVLADK